MRSLLAAIMMFTRLPLWRIVNVEDVYKRQGSNDTQRGIQFVKGPVCFNTNIIFIHPAPAEYSRCSFVPAFRVYSHVN